MADDVTCLVGTGEGVPDMQKPPATADIPGDTAATGTPAGEGDLSAAPAPAPADPPVPVAAPAPADQPALADPPAPAPPAEGRPHCTRHLTPSFIHSFIYRRRNKKQTSFY